MIGGRLYPAKKEKDGWMMGDNSASTERYSSPELLYKKKKNLRLESTLMCDFVAQLNNQRLKKIYVFRDCLVFHSLLSLQKNSSAIDWFLMTVWSLLKALKREFRP